MDEGITFFVGQRTEIIHRETFEIFFFHSTQSHHVAILSESVALKLLSVEDDDFRLPRQCVFQCSPSASKNGSHEDRDKGCLALLRL